ncbi:MAG: hypothetical protein AUI08_12260 [Gemmatimonadetes bacterium 13_2_20CM_2_65_7]|nr:MAG: hypothetical protein AUI08_12260 [Gemmatimonadetes bacterium 13_2_20CM_2_65_7]
MRLLRVLYGSSAGFALVAVGLQLAPTAPPRAPASESVAPGISHATERPVPTAPPATYATIVSTNIFSTDRVPPRVRFTPPGLAARGQPVHRAPAVRLYGITIGASGTATALIDADPDIPGAEIYHIGDVVAGAPIVDITDSTVVLAQPSGQRVLHLQRSSRRQP